MQVFVESVTGSAPRAVSISPFATAEDLIHEVLPNAPEEGTYLSFGGKLLSRSTALVDSGVKECSTVRLGLRVRGGGGDGGATGAESRDCYLNMYREKKPDKVDPNEARLARCQCALTNEALKPPCVADALGNVFNKEAVVHALLTKAMPKKYKYIRGLKDFITVELTPIPGIDADDEHAETKFHCPITGQEFNGKFKFLALKGCGHVLSARAFKEIQSTTCLVCYKEFKETDKIILNGTEEEVAALRERMEADKASSKSRRKEKNGTKTNGSEAAPELQNGVKRKETPSESPEDKAEAVPNGTVKKTKPTLPVPDNASTEVYRSIFTSSGKNKVKETYSCRALPLGRN